VSGGTRSGKTTLLNALSGRVADVSGLDQRIVIIEDTREIVCNAPNTVQMLTDTDANIDMTRLLKLTLRYRPDRIFVGEVRDGAALALLKAWNTGHPGGLAALIRLDQLCQEAGVPSQMPLIREAVDVVVQIRHDPAHPAGRVISDIVFFEKE
jgi:Flp pilus assembly CpaF family ATPase